MLVCACCRAEWGQSMFESVRRPAAGKAAGKGLGIVLTSPRSVLRPFTPPLVNQRPLARGPGLGAIQAKLTVNQPGDRYEQEADRVAEQVMRMPGPAVMGAASREADGPPGLQRKCATCASGQGICSKCSAEEQEETLQRKPLSESITPLVQRQADTLEEGKEEEDEELLQTKRAGGGIEHDVPEVTPELSARINAMRDGGQPLSQSERDFFEPRFGHDFSRVRIHADAPAAETARALGARAFTLGSDIAFGHGQYSQGASGGQGLLAHELTHVVQQFSVANGASLNSIRRAHKLENDPDDAPAMSCDVAQTSPAGVSLDVTFGIERSTLSAADRTAVSYFVGNWHLASVAEPVRVDGYASIDGPPSFNWPLSCRRAEALVNELVTPSDGSPGIPFGHIEYYAQGETNQFSPSLAPNRRAQAHIPSALAALPTSPPAPAPTPARFVACFDGSTVRVSKNGTQHQCPAVTGNVGLPTPNGEFCIREQGRKQTSGHGSWHLLEPLFPTTRSRMHLHPGTASSGCVTVTDVGCFNSLATILNGPGRVTEPGHDGCPPGNKDCTRLWGFLQRVEPKKDKICVGRLLVTNDPSRCANMF